jgi:hypothetical protein
MNVPRSEFLKSQYLEAAWFAEGDNACFEDAPDGWEQSGYYCYRQASLEQNAKRLSQNLFSRYALVPAPPVQVQVTARPCIRLRPNERSMTYAYYYRNKTSSKPVAKRRRKRQKGT